VQVMNISMNMRKNRTSGTATYIPWSAAILSLSLIAACSSDSPDPVGAEIVAENSDNRPGVVVNGLNGADTQSTRTLWFVNAFFFRSDTAPLGSNDAGVSLFQLNDEFVIEDLLGFADPDVGRCDIDSLNPGIPVDNMNSGNDDDNGSSSSTQVSGGPALTIDTPQGPWAQIGLDASSDEIRYENNSLPGPIPANASLYVLGDVFPQTLSIPLVEPLVPVRLSPDFDEPLNENTVFSWIPGSDPDVYIQITFRGLDINDNFIEFPGRCIAPDTGNFSMPPDALALLQGYPDKLVVRYERVLNTAEVRGDMVIRTRMKVVE